MLNPTLRGRELALLPFPWLVAVTGFALLSRASVGAVTGVGQGPAMVFAAALLVAHLALTVRGFRGDQLLLPLVAMLAALGLILAYRLAPALAARQLTWVLLGLAAMFTGTLMPRDLRPLRRYRYTWLIFGLGLVALTLVFGRHPMGSGARLWLGLGSFLFQPSELLKILLVVFLASYLDEKRELLALADIRLGPLRLPPLPYLGPLLLMWGFSMVLLIWQRDLGAAFLFFAIFLAMLYLASSRASYVWMGLVFFVAGVLVIVRFFAHVQTRVAIWLDPWADAAGRSYQVVQGLLALASGGVFGRGLGQGYPTYIPAVHTDFVLAAIGEELGLAGAVAVVALYILLVHRGFRIALSSGDSFAQLLAAGLTAILGFQTLIIVAGVLRLIPLTGVTLPFVSYGGSSLVASFFIVGLLLRISESVAGQAP